MHRSAGRWWSSATGQPAIHEDQQGGHGKKKVLIVVVRIIGPIILFQKQRMAPRSVRRPRERVNAGSRGFGERPATVGRRLQQ